MHLSVGYVISRGRREPEGLTSNKLNKDRPHVWICLHWGGYRDHVLSDVASILFGGWVSVRYKKKKLKNSVFIFLFIVLRKLQDFKCDLKCRKYSLWFSFDLSKYLRL